MDYLQPFTVKRINYPERIGTNIYNYKVKNENEKQKTHKGGYFGLPGGRK
jgi:hypothetical protein